MSRLTIKLAQSQRRAHRVRAQIKGTAKRPRLTVRISNRHIIAQLVDDASSKTVAYVTSAGFPKTEKTTMVQKAVKVGEEIAKLAKTAKIQTVVFDRGSKLYHGRIKALAEAARTAGLEF